MEGRIVLKTYPGHTAFAVYMLVLQGPPVAVLVTDSSSVRTEPKASCGLWLSRALVSHPYSYLSEDFP